MGGCERSGSYGTRHRVTQSRDAVHDMTPHDTPARGVAIYVRKAYVVGTLLVTGWV